MDTSPRACLPRLIGRLSAVDGEGAPTTKLASGAAEPEHGRGDFVGGAEASDGLVGQLGRFVEFAVGDHGGDQGVSKCRGRWR